MITFSETTIVLGGKVIVENLNFTVGQGEFVCIIGASGCGKTTALRLAAGLYQPSGGKVTFDGKPMTAPRRDIAIIFQDYGKALLPWRTAAGNVSLALEAAGVSSAKRAPRIAELLDKVGLPDHAGKYPAEMSCVTMKMVIPVSCQIFSSIVCISRRMPGSSAPNGSSINRIFGRFSKA